MGKARVESEKNGEKKVEVKEGLPHALTSILILILT